MPSLTSKVQNLDERLAGTRGERRFAALNPRGSVDFFLPSSSVNDYVDMITAHSNYWSDPNFSAFILNETFGTGEEDKSDKEAKTDSGDESDKEGEEDGDAKKD